ncbi:MAG TPA: TonB family protein [Bryobacteraceae bacterium]|nr:TonB family protein [Bryobacteraceae bacterium]
MLHWFALLAWVTAAAQSPVFHLGPDIAAPFVVSKGTPEYSDEARLAKLEGSVQLTLVVDADGKPSDIQVIRPLGLGLDERAVENAGSWQFKPGTKAGVSVAVMANEEVFFRVQRTLWDWHVVRAIFQPPAQATRPVLIKVKFPATIPLEENASVTIAFDVARNGVPANLRVVKSSAAKWEGDLLAAVRDGWRFRPGIMDHKPVTVPAWFEFVRGSHSPIPPAQITAR